MDAKIKLYLKCPIQIAIKMDNFRTSTEVRIA